MAVPSYRNPIRPARGTEAALADAGNQGSFATWELLHGTDGDSLFVWDGTNLNELYATQLGLKADLVNGKLDTSQLPDLAISEFLGEVADQTARLALTGQRGDWCLQVDEGLVYILVADGGSQLTDWRALSYPAAAVTSVNGQTGVVVLTKADVGLGNVDNTSDADKPISTATQNALDLKAPLASPAFTGNPTAPTPAQGDNDTSIATTAYVTGAIGDLGDVITEAPSDGKYYVRLNGTWVDLVVALTALGDNNTVT